MALWWNRPRRLTASGPSRADRLRGRRSGAFAQEIGEVHATRRQWSGVWAEATEGCNLAKIVRVPAGLTVSPPRLAAVLDEDDPWVPTRLVAEMRPGQSLEDWRDKAPLLALAFGAQLVTIRERGGRWLELVLWDVDPLSRPYVFDGEPLGFLGCDEAGEPIVVPWFERGHAVLQGATGSGKSTLVYTQLAQVADRPDVLVTGVDPSGVVFRPWGDHPARELRASGIGDDLKAARCVLAELVAELDRRISLIPASADLLVPDISTPLMVCVLEELPALYREADNQDRKVGREVRSAVGRLISEGRKVAIRLMIVCQRADAAVVDGAVRAQASLRVSYACDDDALAMLHPRNVIDGTAHALAGPGVALVSSPGLGHVRMRAPALPYEAYVARVSGSSAVA